MGWPGATTGRQFRAWAAWCAEDYNRPSRTDHYLIAVRAEIRAFKAMFSSRAATFADLMLKFEIPETKAPLTAEEREALEAERLAQDKARWASYRKANAQTSPPPVMTREQAERLKKRLAYMASLRKPEGDGGN